MRPVESVAVATRSSVVLGPKKPTVEHKGFLTVEQVAHLSKLIEEKNQAIEANTKAESAMLDACAALEKYLDELTIKK